MRKVVVATEHRGVFFGEIESEDDAAKICVLKNARNCLYWHSSTKGFLGLAKHGPLGESRVGPAVSTLKLYDVTAIVDCEQAAVEKWEAGPWS